jgi:hypothetical protein
MKTVLFALAAASATALCAGPAAAWDQIATREVRERMETDVVSLPGGREFRRLKVCVYRNPVHFRDMDVRFRNGGRQDVSLRSRINAGGCTRVIDLEGGSRDVQTITMRYEETSRGRLQTATVRIFAE